MKNASATNTTFNLSNNVLKYCAAVAQHGRAILAWFGKPLEPQLAVNQWVISSSLISGALMTILLKCVNCF